MPRQSAGLLHGAEAIAEYIGVNRRQVYHMIDTAGLPIFKITEGKIAARQEAIDLWLAEREAAARKTAPAA